MRAFADRRDAGEQLARELMRRRPELCGRTDVVVLGLARGGVPVAAAAAAALAAELDVLVVRKVGLPSQPELAMGAVAEAGERVHVVRNESVLVRMSVPAETFDEVCARETRVLRERAATYRQGRPPLPLSDRIVVIVDDGLATGSSMRAAVAASRAQAPREIVIAVPVGAMDTCRALGTEADDVVCAQTPEPFYAVGQAYRDFAPTTDDAVTAALTGGQAPPDE